ncbi:MAG: hypothetical protein K6U87_04135 [Firmicutes bacterium]|nr:hypothetical protein [Bacillota bacterium]
MVKVVKETANVDLSALVEQGGIYKRIDEVRELFELLKRDDPAFLATHPWVAGWLQSTDDFLVGLAERLDADRRLPMMFPHRDSTWPGGPFPRPRPSYHRR